MHFKTFDQLNYNSSLFSEPTTYIASVFRRDYAGFFAQDQTPPRLAILSGGDTQLLFSAAQEVQAYTDDPRYVHDMRLDLGELERRGLATPSQYEAMYQALVASRMFTEAHALARSHPAPSIERLHSSQGDVLVRETMEPLPPFRDASSDGKAGPTEIVFTEGGRDLVRRDVRLDSPAQVVVVISPSCDFAQNGIKDIESDPQLNKVFEHAYWIVPPFIGESFAGVASWNRAHPYVIMAFAYNVNEWGMLDRWNTPTFYFFKGGKVTAELVGWNGGESKAKVWAALRDIGNP